MCRLAVLFILLLPITGFSASLDTDPKLDALVQGCVRQANRDRICDSLITLQIIGNDSIEAIKEYVHLGVYEYYALTALNYAATGRLRLRFPVFRGKWTATFDSQRDSTDLIFSTRF